MTIFTFQFHEKEHNLSVVGSFLRTDEDFMVVVNEEGDDVAFIAKHEFTSVVRKDEIIVPAQQSITSHCFDYFRSRYSYRNQPYKVHHVSCDVGLETRFENRRYIEGNFDSIEEAVERSIQLWDDDYPTEPCHNCRNK